MDKLEKQYLALKRTYDQENKEKENQIRKKALEVESIKRKNTLLQ
jgi:hypothetical protein